MCVLSRSSPVWLCVTPWTVAHQAPLPMEFSRQEYWSELPVPSSRGSSRPRDRTQFSYVSHLMIPRLSGLLHWQVGSLPLVPPGKPLTPLSKLFILLLWSFHSLSSLTPLWTGPERAGGFQLFIACKVLAQSLHVAGTPKTLVKWDEANRVNMTHLKPQRWALASLNDVLNVFVHVSYTIVCYYTPVSHVD